MAHCCPKYPKNSPQTATKTRPLTTSLRRHIPGGGVRTDGAVLARVTGEALAEEDVAVRAVAVAGASVGAAL